MEILDVVNEKNEIIGKEPKIICHEKKLIHRGSALVIFCDESRKKILLQKRSSQGQDPGLLCSPGGHVRADETYEAAAKRECQEEIFSNKTLPENFFITSKLTNLFTFFKNDPHDREFISVFTLIYAGPFEPLREEVESLTFHSFKNIEKEIEANPEKFTFTFREIIKKFGAYQSKNKKATNHQ